MLSFQVFEHIQKTAHYLSEIRRVLKPILDEVYNVGKYNGAANELNGLNPPLGEMKILDCGVIKHGENNVVSASPE